MSRSILILILALGISGLAAKPARACTCAAPAGPAEGLKRSTAVFRGIVTEINRPLLDRPGLIKSGGRRVKFAILKQ
jgi:hypothetical protein